MATFAIGAAAIWNTMLAAGVFLISGLASSHAWAVFGASIGKALDHGWRLRAFNMAMALLLVSSAVWLVLSR